MYITLKRDDKLLCDVDIHTTKHEWALGPGNWGIEIYSYIDIQNFAETLLKIPEMFNLAQNEFILDFKYIQGFRKDYMEEISKLYPAPQWYELEDPQFKEDQHKVIEIIKEKMKEIANKWGLVYNED